MAYIHLPYRLGRRAIRLPDIRSMAAVVLLVGLVFISGISGRIADFFVTNWSTRLIDSATAASITLYDDAEFAVYMGGIEVSRSRNAIAGSGLGCVAGGAAGAAAATAAGFFTGGAGFAAIPAASATGCGLGMMAGIMFGRTLDDYGDLD
jgi:hypothetical protein